MPVSTIMESSMRQYGKTPSNCQSKCHTPRIGTIALLMTLVVLALVALSSYASAAGGGGGSGGSGGDGDTFFSGTSADSGYNNDLKGAVAKIDKGAYEEAIGDLRDLLMQNPKDPDLYNYLGFAYRKMGQYDKAGQNYDKALALDPEHKGALEYQGELFIKLGDLDAAQGNLDKLDSICFFGCEEYTLLKTALKKAQ
ncbi:tetratricopeptide repeat protein [Rhodovibrionaceae bacterium A322]